ncbi:DUF3519 domain-containing protein, partial [Helicobacter pylori]|uniref:DUF3519 domain-containing protein n=1 Tax=Helicobacter pylori TaxID=210 RepID=UPI0018A1A88D
MALDSFKKLENDFRYAYEWVNDGVKLRVVADRTKDKHLIFDYYSNRNLAENKGNPHAEHVGDKLYELDISENDLITQELANKELADELFQNALSPLEQANAEKLLKLKHAITP